MQINRTGDTLQLLGVRELDASIADQVKQAVLAVYAEGLRNIESDMSEVEFIDGRGLGALIAMNRSCRMRNGNLRLANPSPAVARVLQLTQFAGAFEVVGDPMLTTMILAGLPAGSKLTAPSNDHDCENDNSSWS